MRNPVRLKNLRLRFLPVALAVGSALLWLEPRPASLALGSTVVLLGLALRAWGAGHLIKREQLIVSGPYAHVRHPLYLGTLLICAGFGVALGTVGWGLFALVSVWFFGSYFPAKERQESQLLEQRYGGVYAFYRSRVGALTPSVAGFRVSSAAHAEEPRALAWSGSRYADNNELGTALGVALALGLIALRLGPL